jgi:homopolymeric O-antigen transport system ATP-binding protein
VHPAIRVDGLSKLYRVGARQQGYRTLRESIVEACAAPWRRIRQSFSPRAETDGAEGRLSGENFWALKDVSFDVQPGEVVGIIGRNGAGKSTLLKILSRITEPTSGRIELRGRVGSLLEVGTGFHPELTGRENVYMNGSILGMSRREIQRKFDEIVAFAEVEDFLDTPVKRYSSGMYVRLAFAVAAHLEPEILIVDEVLAVGDAAFQAKCIAKMNEVSRHGRTVLFVSHNADAIQKLCNRVVLLKRGLLADDGNPSEVLRTYGAKGTMVATPGGWVSLRGASRRGTGEARFSEVRVFCKDDPGQPALLSQRGVVAELRLETDQARIVRLAVAFYHRFGTPLVNADTVVLGRGIQLEPGTNTVRVIIDQLHLTPGEYQLGLWLAEPPQELDHVPDAAAVEVAEESDRGLMRRALNNGCVACSFTVEVGDNSLIPC